jgi:uncharacterized membrane protein
MMWSVVIILLLLIPLFAVVMDSPLGQALARRVEGGVQDDARLRAVETEVEQLARDMERLQEQSEFLTKLLEERSDDGGGRTLPPADRPDD